MSAERLENRKKLVSDIDTLRRDVDAKGDIAGLDTFYRDAMEMVTNTKAMNAFDVNKEPVKLRDRYGRNDLGQCCLLARRLVEAGVTFVTVQAGGGWDTHGNNFTELKRRLLPQFDAGVAALVEDLHDRGLSDDVLVMSMGEFGRTPKINTDAGRDHWPGAMSILYAGGGLKMGQMIGTTDCDRVSPRDEAVHAGLRAQHDVSRARHRPQARLLRRRQAPAAGAERGRPDQGTRGVMLLAATGCFAMDVVASLARLRQLAEQLPREDFPWEDRRFEPGATPDLLDAIERFAGGSIPPDLPRFFGSAGNCAE